MTERSGPLTPFVGRQHELAELTAALNDALAVRGRVLLVAGEPGIGKTRTVEELINQADTHDASILWGRCQEWQGAPPYWPFVQIIRQYLDHGDDAVTSETYRYAAELAHIVPEMRRVAPEPPALPDLSPDQARFRLFDGVANLFRHQAARAPIILVFDDLHRADHPTLLLLEFLAREIGRYPICIVGTYRSTEVRRGQPLAATLAELHRDPHTVRVPLLGLTEDDIEDYIKRSTAQPAPAGLATKIYRATEGNAFFVTEVLRLLLADTRSLEGDWTIRLPESVRETVGERLNDLSHECNQVLTAASVIGRDFDLQLLQVVTDTEMSDLLDLLDEALRADVIQALDRSGEYRFKHVLIREALYEELATANRMHLHNTIGESLEQLQATNLSAFYSELAHHYAESALTGNTEKAITYLKAAGDQAMQHFAWEKAVEHYDTLLGLFDSRFVEDASLQCEVLLSLSEATWGTGDAYRARELAVGAAALARSLDDLEYVIRAAQTYAGGNHIQDIYSDPQAVALLEEALEIVDASDRARRADLLARMVLYLPPTGSSHIKRRESAHQAVSLAREVGDDWLQMRTLYTLSIALHDGPDTFQESVRTARVAAREAALELAEQLGDETTYASCFGFRFHESLLTGDMTPRGLRQGAHRAQQLMPESLSLTVTPFPLYMEMHSLVIEGSYDEALAAAQTIRQQIFSTNYELFPLWLSMYEYVIHRERCSLEELLPQLDQYIEIDFDFATYWRIRRCLALLESGAQPLAVETFDSLTDAPYADVLSGWSGLVDVTALAEIAHLLDDREESLKLYELLAPYANLNATTLYLPEYAGSVSYYLGLLATTLERWGDAERHFEDALAMHEKMELPPYIAHTKHQLAVMLVKRGKSDDLVRARDLNERALGAARDMGMVRLERLAAALAEEIETAAHPETTDSTHGLTPRELDVLQLIADGNSDREIAEALHISPRTVMTHVSNILSKFGVDSRTAASAVAVREGILSIPKS